MGQTYDVGEFEKIMEEGLALADYLPIEFKAEAEEKYIRFLWDAFQTNYEAEKYEFAGIAFHLLYMSFVSFSVWQIRAARLIDFDKALIGSRFELSDFGNLIADDPHISAPRRRTAAVNYQSTANENRSGAGLLRLQSQC